MIILSEQEIDQELTNLAVFHLTSATIPAVNNRQNQQQQQQQQQPQVQHQQQVQPLQVSQPRQVYQVSEGDITYQPTQQYIVQNR